MMREYSLLFYPIGLLKDGIVIVSGFETCLLAPSMVLFIAIFIGLFKASD